MTHRNHNLFAVLFSSVDPSALLETNLMHILLSTFGGDECFFPVRGLSSLVVYLVILKRGKRRLKSEMVCSRLT